MKRTRLYRTLALSLLVALAGALGASLTACQPARSPFVGEEVLDPQPAPPLAGVNWDGTDFDLADLQGKVVVVFFGYTFCPDICPFTLAKMKQIYGELGERADQLAVVFVSVDPHRDTLEKLSRYVPNFDRRFFGVRLEFDQLDVVTEDWNLTVQYGQPKDGPGSDSYYYVDHTGTFFLLDRAGRRRVLHPPNATVEQLLPDIERLLES
jgi:protein SCO1/2